MVCQDPLRRSLLLTALAAGACLAAGPAAAEEDQPGSDERPQKGDLLVHSDGEHEGEVIKPDDLKLDGLPLHCRLFAGLHTRRMSRHGVGQIGRRREECPEMSLPQLRI